MRVLIRRPRYVRVICISCRGDTRHAAVVQSVGGARVSTGLEFSINECGVVGGCGVNRECVSRLSLGASF